MKTTQARDNVNSIPTGLRSKRIPKSWSNYEWEVLGSIATKKWHGDRQMTRKEFCDVQLCLRRIVLLYGRRQKSPISAEWIVQVLQSNRDIGLECQQNASMKETIENIALANLCRKVCRLDITETLWKQIISLPQSQSTRCATDSPRINSDLRTHDNVEKERENDCDTAYATSPSDEDTAMDSKDNGTRIGSVGTVVQRRIEKWYRQHLDFLIERSRSNRQMPPPKFGTVTADEVLTVYAIFTDALDPKSSDRSVSFQRLLNSKRWQSLVFKPEIDGKLRKRVGYRELLRLMFPNASRQQLKAMLRFSPNPSA